MKDSMQKLSDEDRRDSYITIRAKNAELSKWKEMANKEGISLGAWVREWLNWAIENK